MHSRSHFTFGLLFLLLVCHAAVAADQAMSAKERTFFETKIRPVLVTHCYQCHAEDSAELGGKLLLDSRSGMLKGGESGPSVIAGNPDGSTIIQALRYESFEMPPDKPLSEAVINDFVSWVNRGAKDPRDKKTETIKLDPLDPEGLWSFYPRTEPAIPEVKNKDWSRDSLDQFILEKIEASGMQPTQDASAQTLIRRLYIDLIGLPPTIEQVKDFEEDFRLSGIQATQRLVDDLLNRSQFGERWGRHWLDVARFGESNGDDGLGRNASFPHAWRYRDYVIDAINADIPYDQFITEQIAGDLLPASSAGQRNRQLIATGFLAIGSKPAAAMNKNFAMDIVDDQINVVSTTVIGLSVACARCHDHKHDPIPTADYYAMAGIFKSTETLYGLAANEKLTAPPTELHGLVKEWNPQQLNTDDLQKELKFSAEYDLAIEKLQPDLHERLATAPEQLKVESEVKFSNENFAQVKKATLSGEFPGTSKTYSISLWFKNETKNSERPITAYLFSRAKLGDKSLPGDHIGIGGKHDKSRSGKLFVFNGNQQKKSLAGATVIRKGTWNHIVLVRNEDQIRVHLNGVPEPEIAGELPATFGETLDFCFANRSDNFAPLVGNIADLAIFTKALTPADVSALHQASGQPQGTRPPIGLAMGVREKKKVENCKIHINGDQGKLGPSVSRGVLSAYQQVSLNEGNHFPLSIEIPAKQSGRQELAAWLTHPEHPQTARVLVNRVWLHLYGHGLVNTPDDFGIYGARPTHPELLDHLANRFIQEDWSIKQLIRSIVLSRTYQLDSSAAKAIINSDPENKLYARHSRRRLDAESLRDSILLASGKLDLKRPAGSAIDKTDALINMPAGSATNFHKPSQHRSLYLCLLRHAAPPELAAFDLPDGIGVMGQRDVTTLPTQSLFLMNNEFVIAQSKALAEEMLSHDEWDQNRRIHEIFRRILAREPDQHEVQQAAALLTHIESAVNSQDDTDDDAAILQGWVSFCQALFATNEFRYID